MAYLLLKGIVMRIIILCIALVGCSNSRAISDGAGAQKSQNDEPISATLTASRDSLEIVRMGLETQFEVQGLGLQTEGPQPGLPSLSIVPTEWIDLGGSQKSLAPTPSSTSMTANVGSSPVNLTMPWEAILRIETRLPSNTNPLCELIEPFADLGSCRLGSDGFLIRSEDFKGTGQLKARVTVDQNDSSRGFVETNAIPVKVQQLVKVADVAGKNLSDEIHSLRPVDSPQGVFVRASLSGATAKIFKLFRLGQKGFEQISDLASSSQVSDEVSAMVQYKSGLVFVGPMGKLFYFDGARIVQISNTAGSTKSDFVTTPVVWREAVYFWARNTSNAQKLFRWDGIQTVQISNIFENQGQSEFVGVLKPIVTSLGIIWSQTLTSPQGNSIQRLAHFDGDRIRIYSVNSDPELDQFPRHALQFGDRLFFSAQTTNSAYEIFSVDSKGKIERHTDAQLAPITKLIATSSALYVVTQDTYGNLYELRPAQSFKKMVDLNLVSEAQVIGDRVLMVAANDQGVRKLFTFDGVSAKELSSTTQNRLVNDDPTSLALYNNQIYFWARNAKSAFKLFRTNGETVEQLSSIQDESSSDYDPWGASCGTNPSYLLPTQLGLLFPVFMGEDCATKLQILQESK